jgi:hypothetical protein
VQVVDETIDKSDPRFRAYWPARPGYSPWYCATPEAVIESVKDQCWGCGSHDAPRVGHDSKRLCDSCLSQCIDM